MIGNNIKRLIKMKGISQKDLANKVGCTESAMSKYVKNERDPNSQRLKAIAKALGVSLEELMKDCEWIPEESKRDPLQARISIKRMALERECVYGLEHFCDGTPNKSVNAYAKPKPPCEKYHCCKFRKHSVFNEEDNDD